MLKKLSITIFFGIILVGGLVFADAPQPEGFSYVFHLYYDSGQLFANRDLKYKYDVLPETFIPETFSTQFPYKGEIVNLKGEVANTFQFDPRRSNPQFLKGTLSVKAPYVPDGQKAVFYNSQGQSLLSIFVSDSSFCNDDGVCNSDVGEDRKTCPNDCKAVILTPPVEPHIGQSDVIKILIYLIIGLGVVAGGWFGWKWWKHKKEAQTIEPSLPQLPPDNS